MRGEIRNPGGATKKTTTTCPRTPNTKGRRNKNLSPGTQHQGRRYLRRTRHAVRAKRGGARCPKGTIENSRSRLRGSILGEARKCPKPVLWHLLGGPQKMCRKMSPGTPGGHRNMLKMSLHIFFRALRNFFGLSYLLKGGSSPWGSSKGQKNCAKQKKKCAGRFAHFCDIPGPMGTSFCTFSRTPQGGARANVLDIFGLPPNRSLQAAPGVLKGTG